MTKADNIRSSSLALARQKLAATGLVVVGILAQIPVRADPITVELALASEFALLAGTGVTFIGPTAITGDIGSHPTPTMAGLGNLTLTGVNHADDAVMVQAMSDLLAAYTDAAGRTATVTYSPIYDLGGSTLPSGVYKDPSSFAITGTLTLDAGGDPNAVWIFQAGSTLITASDSIVALINGAQASRVFWQVGSSATLGTGTDFAGSLMAHESITLNTGATVSGGRVLALNGAVTLDTTLITVPEASSALLLIPGAAVLFAIRRRQPCLGIRRAGRVTPHGS